MSLPNPAEDQPYCEISAIDSGSIFGAPLGQLIDTASADEMVDLPCLAFVLRHCRTRDTFLFDLGIRPDPENLKGAIAELTRIGTVVEGRNIPAILEKGGLSRAEVKHVAISHIHYDHTGVPKAFPNAIFLLGAGAKLVIETRGPEFEGTIYAVDVPLERTRFLDSFAQEWAAIGPFSRALDFYGDGSLYIVDTPGHVPGHISVLARTSANGGWVFLAGDSVHDWRLLTGEARVGHHVRLGCIHEDPGKAQETIDRIKALKNSQRVRVLLAHDVPFAKANAENGRGYWPNKIESL